MFWCACKNICMHSTPFFRNNEIGRPRCADTYNVLALVLHYLNAKVPQKYLQACFGLTPASVSRYISMGLGTLERVLKNHEDGAIKWPTETEMKVFADIIATRYPFMESTHIFGFADGTTFDIENASDIGEQNAYYSYTKSRTVVNNVFCFTPDGCICLATINAPGSWHDANLANTRKGLYYVLQRYTPAPFKIVCDQGFVDSSLSEHGECYYLLSSSCNEVMI